MKREDFTIKVIQPPKEQPRRWTWTVTCVGVPGFVSGTADTDSKAYAAAEALCADPMVCTHFNPDAKDIHE